MRATLSRFVPLERSDRLVDRENSSDERSHDGGFFRGLRLDRIGYLPFHAQPILDIERDPACASTINQVPFSGCL